MIMLNFNSNFFYMLSSSTDSFLFLWVSQLYQNCNCSQQVDIPSNKMDSYAKFFQYPPTTVTFGVLHDVSVLVVSTINICSTMILMTLTLAKFNHADDSTVYCKLCIAWYFMIHMINFVLYLLINVLQVNISNHENGFRQAVTKFTQQVNCETQLIAKCVTGLLILPFIPFVFWVQQR